MRFLLLGIVSEKQRPTMKSKINIITHFFAMAMVISFSSFSQQQGTAKADGTATTSIKIGATSYQLEFPFTASDIKGAFMAKAPRFQFIIDLQYASDECDSKSLYNWQEMYDDGSLNSFADSKPFVFQVEGDDVNSAIEREAERCGWAGGKVTMVLMVASKTGQPMTISEIPLNVPNDAQSQSLAGNSGEILKLFKSGLASNKINDRSLVLTVEDYMENKWPSEDITTVHLTDRQSQNAAGTKFRVDGYYITQKGGTCKYNSFYGDGNKTSGGYSITFFNSMNAETTIDCGVAQELKNL